MSPSVVMITPEPAETALAPPPSSPALGRLRPMSRSNSSSESLSELGLRAAPSPTLFFAEMVTTAGPTFSASFSKPVCSSISGTDAGKFELSLKTGAGSAPWFLARSEPAETAANGANIAATARTFARAGNTT